MWVLLLGCLSTIWAQKNVSEITGTVLDENKERRCIQMQEKTFMTIREVAKTGILSEHTIRLMVKAGEVPHIMAGNRVLINYPKFIEQLQITA